MTARPITAILCCLVCCLFPAAVVVMVLTYEQQGGWGEPGPFPYSAVDYVFFADLLYTMILILWMRGRRTVTALVSLPLLVVTGVMVFFAGMWFTGYYL
jgi:hypothetical protein